MRTVTLALFALAVVLSAPSVSHAECVGSCRADDIEDPSGHFRLDVDRLGLQAWAFGQFPVSDAVALSGNIYAIAPSDVPDSPGVRDADSAWRPSSRMDAGVIFRLGVFELLPKLGLAMNYAGSDVEALVPQLFAIVRGGPAHFETWNQLFLSAMFKSGSLDVFYSRNQLLISPWNFLGFGVQVEFTLGVHNHPGGAMMSLPIGGTLQLQPSLTDVIQIFIAGETRDDAVGDSDGVTGRLTYVHTF